MANRDSVTLGVGNAPQANIGIHTIDPFPPEAWDTDIRRDGRAGGEGAAHLSRGRDAARHRRHADVLRQRRSHDELRTGAGGRTDGQEEQAAALVCESWCSEDEAEG